MADETKDDVATLQGIDKCWQSQTVPAEIHDKVKERIKKWGGSIQNVVTGWAIVWLAMGEEEGKRFAALMNTEYPIEPLLARIDEILDARVQKLLPNFDRIMSELEGRQAKLNRLLDDLEARRKAPEHHKQPAKSPRVKKTKGQ